MNMLNQTQLQLVVEKCADSSLDAIWEILAPIHQEWTHFPITMTKDFQSRRDTFLWILENLLREDRIKLHKDGTFLDGSIEEQVKKFRQAFPSNEEDADYKCTKPGYEAPYKHFGMNVWWFMDACPAGVAWRRPNGDYLIDD